MGGWDIDSNATRNVRIFLSYRHGESSGYARAILQSLGNRFGDRVFMDVDSLAPGVDFVDAINKTLSECEVLLALIGPHWLSEVDGGGRRRLENADDFVRLEIETALTRNLRVVPLLVGGARMPASDELPAELSRLARRHAFELSDTRWETDMQSLVEALDRPAVPPVPLPPSVGTTTPKRHLLAPNRHLRHRLMAFTGIAAILVIGASLAAIDPLATGGGKHAYRIVARPGQRYLPGSSSDLFPNGAYDNTVVLSINAANPADVLPFPVEVYGKT